MHSTKVSMVAFLSDDGVHLALASNHWIALLHCLFVSPDTDKDSLVRFLFPEIGRLVILK